MKPNIIIKTILFAAGIMLSSGCDLVFPKNEFKAKKETIPQFFGTYKVKNVHYEADWNGSKYTIDSTYTIPATFTFQADPNADVDFWGLFSVSNDENKFWFIKMLTNSTGSRTLYRTDDKSRLAIFRLDNGSPPLYVTSVLDVLRLDASGMTLQCVMANPSSGDVAKETIELEKQ